MYLCLCLCLCASFSLCVCLSCVRFWVGATQWLKSTVAGKLLLKVVLLKDGEEVQRTECAPHNGYYFLPVEDTVCKPIHLLSCRVFVEGLS